MCVTNRVIKGWQPDGTKPEAPGPTQQHGAAEYPPKHCLRQDRIEGPPFDFLKFHGQRQAQQLV